MSRRPQLSTGPLWRRFLVFLLPLIGQMLGTRALAAVAGFMPVAFFFIAFLIGITAGSSVLTGQALGGGKTETVQRLAGTSMGVSVALGAVIWVARSVFAPQILSVLGTPADIAATTASYARAAFLTMPFLFAFIAAGALLRGTGDWVRPLAPKGLVIASMLRPDPGLLAQVLRIGLPTGLQLVVGSLSGLVILGLINSFGSQEAAACGAVSQVQNYAQFPALSIAIAVVLVELPLAVVLSRTVGLDGIWWAYAAGFAALMVAQGACYALAWRRKRISALI